MKKIYKKFSDKKTADTSLILPLNSVFLAYVMNFHYHVFLKCDIKPFDCRLPAKMVTQLLSIPQNKCKVFQHVGKQVLQ